MIGREYLHANSVGQESDFWTKEGIDHLFIDSVEYGCHEKGEKKTRENGDDSKVPLGFFFFFKGRKYSGRCFAWRLTYVLLLLTDYQAVQGTFFGIGKVRLNLESSSHLAYIIVRSSRNEETASTHCSRRCCSMILIIHSAMRPSLLLTQTTIQQTSSKIAPIPCLGEVHTATFSTI